MKKLIKKLMVSIYRVLNRILPKSRGIAVFSSGNGKSAGGSPGAVFEYALTDPRDYRLFVWFLTDAFCRRRPEVLEELRHRDFGTEDEETAQGGRDAQTDKPGQDGQTAQEGKPGQGRRSVQVGESAQRVRNEQAGKHVRSSRDAMTGVPVPGGRTARTGSRAKKNRRPAVRIVRYGHPLYYWYMARASLWVFDSRQEPYISKGRGVKYLQTWHGTPLKKLGLDIEDMNMAGERGDISDYRRAFQKESSQWDYLIAQNDFSAKTFRRCFAYQGEMLKTGYPRNDALVRTRNTQKRSGNDEKITLLYAPTWRDDKYLGGGWYAYSSPLDPVKLEKMLGSRFRLLIKPHYLVKIREDDIPRSVKDSGFVRVCDGSEEIGELYAGADALITDYSSAMFDYSLLGRPMIFFAAEAPGPLCGTTEEVAEAVLSAFAADGKELWNEKYGSRIKAFTSKYNMYDNGTASMKVWRRINDREE